MVVTHIVSLKPAQAGDSFNMGHGNANKRNSGWRRGIFTLIREEQSALNASLEAELVASLGCNVARIETALNHQWLALTNHVSDESKIFRSF